MLSFLKGNASASSSIHASELEPVLGKIELIDVREPHEYRAGHAPTAKNIPMNTILMAHENLLDKNKEYHIICQSGGRSSSVCRALSAKGYKVINVSGGTGSYRGKLEN